MQPSDKTNNKLGGNVFLLGIVSFLNDISSEMILPILPLYLTALGGGGLAIGLVGGLRDALSSILKIVFGYFSDRSGRQKIFVVGGYLTSGIFKLLIAVANSWQSVFAFTSLERLGKGLRTAPRDAMIAEAMPKARGKGFGFHRAMDTAGAIIGTLLVFILFWYLNIEFKTIILIAAIIGFAVFPPLLLLKDKRKAPQKSSLKISIKSLSPSLKLFLAISGVFALANFSYMFFILRTQDFFTGKMAVGGPVLLYAFYNVFYALMAMPFGIWSDKIGRKKILMAGYALFALTSLGFAFAASRLAFVVLFALYGLVFAMVDGAHRAIVSDLASRHQKATALGTFHSLYGLAALPAGLIAGALWQFNPSYTFIYGAALALLSVVLFAFLGRKLQVS